MIATAAISISGTSCAVAAAQAPFLLQRGAQSFTARKDASLFISVDNGRFLMQVALSVTNRASLIEPAIFGGSEDERFIQAAGPHSVWTLTLANHTCES